MEPNIVQSPVEMPRQTSMEAIVREITQAFENELNVRTIFGAPMKLDEHVVVPVAVVEAAMGVGGGGGLVRKVMQGAVEAAAKLLPASWGVGGGGGLDVRVRPVGFIADGKDGPRFVAIEAPDTKH